MPVIITLLIGSAFALILPAYCGPDEMGHVAYVAALTQGHLPIIPPGQFADIATGTTWQGQHPPLFYLLATPFYFLVGQNSVLGLYVLRSLGVAAFAVTVELMRRLAQLLWSPERAATAVWLFALHPTVAYVCAMANNEALAMTFSVASVWAAVHARNAANDNRKAKRWLALTVLLGGFGLLTKLTAIAGVVAAAWIIGQGLSRRSAIARGAVVLAGAVALWLPWGLYMQSVHGTFVPSPVQRPAFNGGLWTITLYPFDAANLTFVSSAEYAIGVLLPYWLFAPYNFTYYPMLGVGSLISAGFLLLAIKRPELRFLCAGFLALGILLWSQVMFRDLEAALFLARYSPTAAAFAALAVAGTYKSTPVSTRFIRLFWTSWAIAIYIYIFYFFLIGPSSTTAWRN